MIRTSIATSVLVALHLGWATGICVAESPLDAALAVYEAGELDQAMQRFEDALDSGRYEGRELARIHLHLGILYGAAGDGAAAGRAFERALALEPELDAPAELGPELRARFDEIRTDRDGHPLTVTVEVLEQPTPEGPARLQLGAEHAPAELIAAYRSCAPSCDAPDWSTTVEQAPRTEVAIPAEAWEQDAEHLVLSIEALDEHGAVLARTSEQLGRELAAPAARPEPAPEPAPLLPAPSTPASSAPGSDRASAEKRSLWASPWLWTGVGAVIVGAVVTGVLLSTRNSRYVVGAPELE